MTLGVPSNSILFRDPNLFRKPSKIQGKQLVFEMTLSFWVMTPFFEVMETPGRKKSGPTDWGVWFSPSPQNNPQNGCTLKTEGSTGGMPVLLCMGPRNPVEIMVWYFQGSIIIRRLSGGAKWIPSIRRGI